MNAADTTIPTRSLTPLGVAIEGSGADLETLPIETLRELVARHRLVLLRGFRPPASREALAAWSERWGEILRWDFGAVFEVAEHPEPKNYLFTSGSVPYHWDGAFAATAPGLQIFQCIEAPGPGAGGETLFCDTVRLLADVDPATRARWADVSVTYTTEKKAHYGGRVTAKLVDRHPIDGSSVLRFAEPANDATAPLNTPGLEFPGLDEARGAALVAELRVALYEPRRVYAHEWRPGDVLVADNHALLHGRSPYRSSAPRRLWRVHVL